MQKVIYEGPCYIDMDDVFETLRQNKVQVTSISDPQTNQRILAVSGEGPNDGAPDLSLFYLEPCNVLMEYYDCFREIRYGREKNPDERNVFARIKLFGDSEGIGKIERIVLQEAEAQKKTLLDRRAMAENSIASK